MYLYYYGMNQIPFGQTPNTDLFCPTPSHVDAINTVLFALNNGEAICKVTGEVGTGKTLLCRLLIRHLEGKRQIAYIPNAKLSSEALLVLLAKELGLRLRKDFNPSRLMEVIQSRLFRLSKERGPTVLIIDEAQSLDSDALETLRLLTNVETEHFKLIQIVLFAQPELNKTLRQFKLRQFVQRINYAANLSLLSYRQTKEYIQKKIKLVSKQTQNNKPQLINIPTLCIYVIWRLSKGTPRLINTLCHKALLLSYCHKNRQVSFIDTLRAALDTESIRRRIKNQLIMFSAIFASLISGSALAWWNIG